jgi:hypothetical protein
VGVLGELVRDVVVGTHQSTAVQAGAGSHELPDGQALLLGFGTPLGGEFLGALAVEGVAARGVGDVHHGVDVREWPVRVILGEGPAPELLKVSDRGFRANLLRADPLVLFLGLGSCGAKDELLAGEDLHVVCRASCFEGPGHDVFAELLRVLQLGVGREDDVGVPDREVAAVRRITGLEQHRVVLAGAGKPSGDLDVEALVLALHRGDAVLAEPAWVIPGPGDCAVSPGIPNGLGSLDERFGPDVAVLVLEEPAAPEVGAGPCIVRRDDVPRGPAAGQQVQAGKAVGKVGGVVVGGVLGSHQADVGGDGSERGQRRLRVGAASDVEVVDLAQVFAEAEALAEEKRGEQATFGGLGHAAEGFEIRLRAAGFVFPDGGVVDALEEDSELDLPVACNAVVIGHLVLSLASLRAFQAAA